MRWYLRLQLGQQLLGQAIQLIMLSMAISGKVGEFLGIRALFVVLFIPLFVVLFLTCVGTILDKLKWVQMQDEQGRIRSGSWEKSYTNQKHILETVERIELMIHNKGYYP